MLLYFKVKNYRSMRDEAVLDMEAVDDEKLSEELIPFAEDKYLPAVAIYGKNGGGKSNLLRSMWLAVQFICNAQRTQVAGESIPVRPFLLNDYSAKEPTIFEFSYVHEGIKYIYGFAATTQNIIKEYLSYWNGEEENIVFKREKQEFILPDDRDKDFKLMMSRATGNNQLFFAISCTMNYEPCIRAMSWFREKIVFSRAYVDINSNIIDYKEDESMLKAIVDMAKVADVGIKDIKFEIDSQEIDLERNDSRLMEDDIMEALKAFSKSLRKSENDAEISLSMGKIKTTTYHNGCTAAGEEKQYELNLSDESDGTRRLMNFAPDIERTLASGGVLVVDELEKEMHLLLMEYVLKRYQQKNTNPLGAQIIFTTHETSLLNEEILRRDQIYFVDKNCKNGATSLYSLADFEDIPEEADIVRSYLLGKFGAVPDIEEG